MENTAKCNVEAENRRLVIHGPVFKSPSWLFFFHPVRMSPSLHPPVRQCEHRSHLSECAETRWVSQSSSSILKMCFFQHEAFFYSIQSFTQLSRGTNEFQVQVHCRAKLLCVSLEDVLLLPKGNSSELNLNQKIPGQNCLGIALSFSFLSPRSGNNPTKAQV